MTTPWLFISFFFRTQYHGVIVMSREASARISPDLHDSQMLEKLSLKFAPQACRGCFNSNNKRRRQKQNDLQKISKCEGQVQNGYHHVTSRFPDSLQQHLMCTQLKFSLILQETGHLVFSQMREYLVRNKPKYEQDVSGGPKRAMPHGHVVRKLSSDQSHQD